MSFRLVRQPKRAAALLRDVGCLPPDEPCRQRRAACPECQPGRLLGMAIDPLEGTAKAGQPGRQGTHGSTVAIGKRPGDAMPEPDRRALAGVMEEPRQEKIPVGVAAVEQGT